MSELELSAAKWLDQVSDVVLAEYNERQSQRSIRLVGTPERAAAVIRVSKIGKRLLKGADRFVSPREQRDKIQEWCKREGIQLVAVFEEFDVQGKSPLAKRPGLRPAIELVERGGADVLVVAYFDRLVRNLTVQAQIIGRCEGAGGKIVALDVGSVSHETAASWLNATLHGMMAEYHSRITREKTGEAKRDAIARGVPPFANIPPGYRRGDDGRLVVVEDIKPTIVEVFTMRPPLAISGSSFCVRK